MHFKGKFIKKTESEINKILKNFLFLHHAFDFRKKNYSNHQNNIFILRNVYNYGNCKHIAMIVSDYLKRRKLKHQLSLMNGFNEINYSHIIIKVLFKNIEYFIDPISLISRKKKNNFALVNSIGKKIYEVNKALKLGSEHPRLRDFLDIKKFSSAMYFADKKIDRIKLNYINKPKSIKTNNFFYQKKLSSKKIIVDEIIKENLNIKHYKNYVHNRKLILKNINKKTFTLNDLYAPIIDLSIEFEEAKKVKFQLNKKKYFLNKKREFKLKFTIGKKIKLFNNLKIYSNTKIKKVEVTFLSYKPLLINKHF
jgi:hypothetical protein